MNGIIVPSQLEADAVVPQCLDNQYVSDQVFGYLIEHRADYRNGEVRRLRKAEIQTEFIRSLVYSSQVIINRAVMKNNSYLYENYLPQNRESFQAFCKLMRQNAVVPFLFNETSLIDRSEFGVHAEGERALEALVGEVGEVKCLRLAVDDKENRKQTDQLAGRFWDGLVRLKRLNGNQQNAMASELFNAPSPLQESEDWQVFQKSLKNLAAYAFERESTTRNEVYKSHFGCEGCTNEDIALGHFRSPDRDYPFVLEIKKLVDLIYNTNLPDYLKRFTFTPITLPSRTALQDEPVTGQESAKKMDELLSNEDTLDFIRRTFMANTQKAMTLPLLSDLSVADVIELRELPEWERFKDSQRNIVTKPDRCLELFPAFQKDFDAFQHAMSRWYNNKYQKPGTEEKYTSFITFGISIAGKLIITGLGGNHPIEKSAISFVPDFIPKKVKGYVAKLMVSVYDIGAKRLDKNRSYSLELMQTAEELTREDVVDLISRISQKSQNVDIDSGLRLADKGEQ